MVWRVKCTVRQWIGKTETAGDFRNDICHFWAVDELLPFHARFRVVVHFVRPFAAHFVKLEAKKQ